MPGSWREKLNNAQRQAATCGDGPVLVIAGAGTGKTRTLACRVAHLIEQGTAPERILLLTFTRRAAAEMLRRAGGMSTEAATGTVWSGTFHAVANRLLRIHGRAIGLPGDFTVIDQGDAADLMNLIRSDLDLGTAKRRFARKITLVKIYSHTVNAQRPLADTIETYFPWCAADVEPIGAIFGEYVERKRHQHLLDFDDLLLFWCALASSPSAGQTVAGRFDHILVDEYQDTNALQAEILLNMRSTCKNIMVVGDDAQSIYAFRAATIRNILDFPDQFPGALTITLEQNYRSTQPILAAANAVMDQAAERYTKTLWSERESQQKPVLVICKDEADQTEQVCDRILTHLEADVPLMHQAVLFRAGHHSAQLEVELAKRNIPFHKFGGLKFVEAAHIKDMLAFLRVLDNPYDELSWFRILQLFDGIGPRTARRIIGALAGTDNGSGHATGNARARDTGAGDPTGSLSSPLLTLLRQPPPVPPAARAGVATLRTALAQCSGLSLGDPQERDPERTLKPPPLPAQIECIRQLYEPLLEKKYDNAAVRLKDLEQLQPIASRYRSRHRFVTDLTLDPPTSTADLAGPPFLEEDYLTLSTMHSAKGCEWTVVHILHAADGMIPSDMATTDSAGVDEERRLFYVALTRAKDSLYVYCPLRYYHLRHATGDAHSYAQLTRFITPDVRALFAEPGGCTEDDDFPLLASGVDDVADWLNDLWRQG